MLFFIKKNKKTNKYVTFNLSGIFPFRFKISFTGSPGQDIGTKSFTLEEQATDLKQTQNQNNKFIHVLML